MSLNHPKLLVVDDEPAITSIASHYLKSSGFQNVETANDPQAVLGIVARFQPDVLLLDISMPGVSGLEILESLTQSVMEDSLAVIMVTNMNDEHTKRKALILGAVDFISKPFDQNQLADAVSQALQGLPNRSFIIEASKPVVRKN